MILMTGGHVIRSGVQNYLIDVMERGYISCVATNVAEVIHDFEFALVGATTESVARYIQEGLFGVVVETAQLDDIINRACDEDETIDMDEAVGRFLDRSDLGAAMTVHMGTGYDIIHEHPNCDGAATGDLSYNGFIKSAGMVENLEGGVVMNFGSVVMAPEVFPKALSMSGNAAPQAGSGVSRFKSLVCDPAYLTE